MKNTFIGASAALAILVAAVVPTAAQAQSEQSSVPVKAARTATYAMGSNEFAEFANVYKLSNGQVARFTQQGNHYFVQLKGSLHALQRDESRGQMGIATRLRPIGPGQFVTDAGAELKFANDGDEVAIGNFERLPAARVAAAQVNVRMIARR